MYQLSTLTNGMRIATYHMDYLNSTAINLLVNVGSRYETSAEQGISHFLEHMAFKGTKSRSAKDIAEEFDNIGGCFNAYTSREHTVYHAKTLTEHLGLGVDIIADIIQNSIYKEEEIAKERQVIHQEMFQTMDNPDDLCHEKLWENSFGGDHPFGRSILGTAQTIDIFTNKDFHNYTNKHYYASNMILSVAGNAKHEEILTIANKLFSQPADSKKTNFSTANYKGGIILTNKDLEQVTMILSFPSPSRTASLQERTTTSLLSLLLGGGISSRLFQKIREELGLVYYISTGNIIYHDIGMFCIQAATSPDKLLKLINALADELKSLETIKEFELTRAKAQLKANILLAQESSSRKSEAIAYNLVNYGRFIDPNEILALLPIITKEDLQILAQKIFTSKAAVSLVGNLVAAEDQIRQLYELHWA